MEYFVFIAFNILLVEINCEWVEISQVPIQNDKSPYLDFTKYVLTTTSTTTVTPVTVRPTIKTFETQVKVPIAKNRTRNYNSNNFKNRRLPEPQLRNNIVQRKSVELDQSSKKNVAMQRKNVALEQSKQNQETTALPEKLTTFVYTGDFVKTSDSDQKKNHEAKKVTDNNKDENGYSLAGFLPFLSSVQNTLIKKARNTINSKIDMLRKLRDNILIQLEYHMNTFWAPKSENREAREHSYGDSHVDFPSNEGALMTIGFLTFAAFLIKLVLKLILVIKNKKNYYDPYYYGTTAPANGRKRREVVDNEAIRILKLIEQYKFQ